jgi:DNA-binding transcriptional LysR family regulator
MDMSELKLPHLRLIAALGTTGQLSMAATQTGISQPAASRLLAEVEQIIGHPVHTRQGRGITLTAQGAALARRAARILIELNDATRELHELTTGTSGHVRIGAITGAALDRVLPALRQARLTLPDITTEVEVGPSDLLTNLIANGQLDFALCRLPAHQNPADFSFSTLGDEQVNLVVRRDHALLHQPEINPADLLHYDWVLPPGGAILRQAVLSRLSELGHPAPPGRLTTGSFLLTLAMLSQSNAIAPLSRSVAQRFATDATAPYATLPLDLGIRMAAFGLVTRAGAVLTPAAGRIKALILHSAPSP